MRLAIVAGSLPPILDGVSGYTERLIEEIVARDDIDLNLFTSFGVTVPVLATPFAVYRSKWGIIGAMMIVRRLRRLNVDATILEYPAHGYGKRLGVVVLPMLIALSRLRLVLRLHEYSRLHPLRRLAELLMCLFCKCIAVAAEEDALKLKSLFPNKMIKLVPVSSNIRHFQLSDDERKRLRTLAGGRMDSVIIGYFGSIYNGKSYVQILNLANYLDSTGVHAVVVVIGGHDIPPSVHETVISFGLRERVYFTGYLPEREVSFWIQSVDVMVFPFRDGASLNRGSLFAALEHRVPTITTFPLYPRTKGFLQQYPNIWFYERDSDDDLRKSFEGIMEGKASRSQRGYDLVGFAWSDVVDHLIDFMETYRAEVGNPLDRNSCSTQEY